MTFSTKLAYWWRMIVFSLVLPFTFVLSMCVAPLMMLLYEPEQFSLMKSPAASNLEGIKRCWRKLFPKKVDGNPETD